MQFVDFNIFLLCFFFVPYAPWQVSQNVPSMNKSLKCQHTCRLISLTCLQGSAGLFPVLLQELTGLILNLFLPHSPRQPVRRGLCENGSVHRSAPRLVNREQSGSYRATTSQQSNDWESEQRRSWGDSEAWLIAPCWDPERKSSSMFVQTLRTYPPPVFVSTLCLSHICQVNMMDEITKIHQYYSNEDRWEWRQKPNNVCTVCFPGSALPPDAQIVCFAGVNTSFLSRICMTNT